MFFSFHFASLSHQVYIHTLLYIFYLVPGNNLNRASIPTRESSMVSLTSFACVKLIFKDPAPSSADSCLSSSTSAVQRPNTVMFLL